LERVAAEAEDKRDLHDSWSIRWSAVHARRPCQRGFLESALDENVEAVTSSGSQGNMPP